MDHFDLQGQLLVHLDYSYVMCKYFYSSKQYCIENDIWVLCELSNWKLIIQSYLSLRYTIYNSQKGCYAA